MIMLQEFIFFGFWGLVLLVIVYYGVRRYRISKKEDFEDREN